MTCVPCVPCSWSCYVQIHQVASRQHVCAGLRGSKEAKYKSKELTDLPKSSNHTLWTFTTIVLTKANRPFKVTRYYFIQPPLSCSYPFHLLPNEKTILNNVMKSVSPKPKVEKQCKICSLLCFCC